EQLALAEAREYPVWLIERLEALTARGHQRIYRETDFGLDKLRRLFVVDFPASVRAHWRYVLVAIVVFAGPLALTGLAAYLDPGFVLSLHDAANVDAYEQMYGEADGPLGRRGADSDWAMFGFYVFNNIRIAFQCFAGGLFFGIGSVFYLAMNGAFAGSLAGYVTWRGYGTNFYSFVITHGAFELTGIVLSGAAGLMLGHALLAPGRRSRLAALADAARRAIVIVYGMTAMFLVAAALEAFWSSVGCAGSPSSPTSRCKRARREPRRWCDEGRRDPARPPAARHVRGRRPRRAARLRTSPLGVDELRAGLRGRSRARRARPAARRRLGGARAGLAEAVVRSL